MAKIHDLFIIELAEVIKGYGNDPDVEDPFRMSEFYRFYELPNIAVSRENFEKMRPAQPEQRWIPVSERLPEEDIKSYAPYDEHLSAFVLVTLQGQTWPYEKKTVKLARYSYTRNDWRVANNNLGKVIAWMPLPESYKGEQE